MGAGDDDRPDARLDEALELADDALDGATRLDVGVEEVTRDQEEVDLLGQGQVDRGAERSELAIPLGGRLDPEVVVARAEMDVRGVDDP